MTDIGREAVVTPTVLNDCFWLQSPESCRSALHNVPDILETGFHHQMLTLVQEVKDKIGQSSQLNDDDAPLTFRLVRLVNSSAEATLEVWP